MATISNTPRPGYVWDSTDNVWYPIGVGNHNHSEIQKTIVDAKGDLIVGTANDTVARLGVGADASYLVADSTQATGLNWASGNNAAAGKNAVINGGMDIWQRGTSFTPAAGYVYTADRMCAYRAVTGYTAAQVTSGVTGINYALKLQRTAGNTATNNIYLLQTIETANTIPLAGKTLTLSFYAKAGANFSATSNNIGVNVYTGTGTDQGNAAGGWTGLANPLTTTQAITTTITRYTFTFTVASTITELQIQFDYAPTGTAGADDSLTITGVQLELGSTATPFSRAGGTIQGELAACQRYYYRATATNGYSRFGNGSGKSTTLCWVTMKLPVQMRIAPSAIDYSAVTLDHYGGGTTAISSIVFVANHNLYPALEIAVASGLTQYSPYDLIDNGTGAGYIGFSAEL